MFDGVIEPGEPILEAHVARTLGVSRGPVREALAALEQEGLVRRAPNRRASMVRLVEKDIEEICSLRLSLEALAVRSAILNATQDDIERLDANTRTMAAAHPDAETPTLDIQFHEAIVRSTGHDRLLATWLNLRSQIRMVMVAPYDPMIVEVHRGILHAIAERDERAAVKAIEDHLNTTRMGALRVFRSQASAGTARDDPATPESR